MTKKRPPKPDHFSSLLEARKKAMDYLARREYAGDELCQKLANAGFDAQVAQDAVKRLTSEGLQNDRRFVAAFVHARINQGKGPARIRADLRQRGISDVLLSEALNDSEQDWFALAREVRARKFGADLPRDFKEKARQMRFLQSRGFESDHIQAAADDREH
ncbi:MAG TPA: regulatory protein RecX [Woeseiaceae bacterium]|nr:regulatory protein RecX [Woeseiaceae bacterium]